MEAEIASWRAALDAELDRVLPRPIEAPTRVHEAMRYAVLGGGKRLRPLFALTVSRGLGLDSGVVIPFAACLELVHASSLVLDDLPGMDDDDLRRGRPACHRAYGEAAALLASTGLLLLSFERLAEAARMHGVEAGALSHEFARALGSTSGLIAGQARDLWPASPGAAGEIARTHEEKTGRLFGLAAVLPARVAGLPDAVADRYREAGTRLGLAFQIADDVRDRTLDAAELGRASGRDQAKGKLTYPAIVGHDQARAEAERLARESIGALIDLTGDARLGWLAGIAGLG